MMRFRSEVDRAMSTNSPLLEEMLLEFRDMVEEIDDEAERPKSCTMKLEARISSLKVKLKKPMFMSRSKPTSIGGVVSLMYVVAMLLEMGMTSLPDTLLMTRGIILM